MHTVTMLAQLLKNKDGATAIEYALIAVAAMTTVGTNLTTLFTTIATSLNP